jgi:hypothetical protein
MKDLLEKHPLTASEIRQFFKNRLVEGMKSLDNKIAGDEFVKFIETFEVDNEKVEMVIDGQPSALFEFFDSKELYGFVIWKKKWKFGINETNTIASFASRKEAELECVKQLFGLSEGILKNGNVGVSESNSSGGGGE